MSSVGRLVLASGCLAALVGLPPAAIAGSLPGTPAPDARGQAAASPRAAGPSQPAAKPAAPPSQAPRPASSSEAELGVKIYPTAEFIGSFDAGRGQRYYLFGASATFAEIVAYYRTVLKNKGDLVYEDPLIHMFEIGRFREETMAFPPSVTVKDYASGGAQGYLHPLPGGQSKRYATVIQVVPAPPAERR